MEQTRTVLISGASVAGPALALLLERDGWGVTVVERTSELRRGGQAVDFKGATHRTVLERMGILDEVYRRRTDPQDGIIVDATGRRLATIPAAFIGGDVEIRRGDLAALLVERTSCEYLFGDSVTSLTERGDGVDVTFTRAAPRTFDLVVGADGIHSNVRRLAFGPEERFVKHLGHYYALADLGVTGDDEMYNEPGRMAATGGPKAPAFFVFASPPLAYDRFDTEQQKKLLRDAYRGMGWRVPELMAALPGANDVYLDAISRVDIDRYTAGRVVLLGDAGYGNTLGGFGTGLAIVGAYVLAGELRRAGGDHRAAFARYEVLMRKYSTVTRKGNAGTFLAPATPLRMRLRNAVFASRTLLKGLMWLTDRLATSIELPDYA